MKSTKDDIVYIATYLINNEAIYIDIHQEMLDPVASALEQKPKSKTKIYITM